MNPLEIHKHVAQSSGREVGDVSPLAAELTALASEASAEAVSKPSAVSEFEQGIKPEHEVSGDVEEVMDHALGRAREHLELFAPADAPSVRIDAMAEMLALKGWDRDVYETALATIHGSSSSPYKAEYYAALAIALPQMSLDTLARQAADNLTDPREKCSAYISVWSLTGDPDDLKLALTTAAGISVGSKRARECVHIATKTCDPKAVGWAQEEVSSLPDGFDKLLLRAKILKVGYSEEECSAIRNEIKVEFRDYDREGLEEIYQALMDSMIGNVPPQAITNMVLEQHIEDTDRRNDMYASLAAAFAQNGQEGKAHSMVSLINDGVGRCGAALEIARATRSDEAIGRVKNMADFMSEDNVLAMSVKASIMIGLAELTGDVDCLRRAIELIDSCEPELGVYVLPRYMAVAVAADTMIHGEPSEKIKGIKALWIR
jgi:hypothetical protein